ncbi:hypothetical protein T484DRAFT_1790958 [Baffinella frigidus]|nr:hypothetical protein T484DRAFT_1790958 [Cryptophyta sp. CCMP2293]
MTRQSPRTVGFGVRVTGHAGAHEPAGGAEGEIAFVDSATRGWCLAFYSIPLKKGDRIITGAADYGSNFVAYLQARDRHGAELVVVPDDASGQIDLDAPAGRLVNARVTGHADAEANCPRRRILQRR